MGVIVVEYLVNMLNMCTSVLAAAILDFLLPFYRYVIYVSFVDFPVTENRNHV